MPKQEQQNTVELLDPKEVERVSYCAGAYLSAFSKEPFDEKWSVDGVESSGLLLNPKTTGEFVREILNEEDTKLFSLSDGTEKAKVQKEIVLKHINNTLSDSMTEYLFSSDWISEEEIANLIDLKNILEEEKEDFVEIGMVYPLTKIMNSYIDVVRRPESLVLLGYQDEVGEGLENKVKFLRLQPDTVLPNGVWPRLLARYLTINSPKSLETQNSTEAVITEVKDYLNEDDLARIKGFVNPDEYTVYLGEIAKIGKFSKNFRANVYTGVEYLKLLTSIPEDKKEILSIPDLVPRQIVYFTFEGTTIAEKEQDSPNQSKFYTMIQQLFEPLGAFYEEKILELQDKNSKKMYLTNIKKI